MRQIFFILLFSISILYANESAKIHILVLHSYNKSMSWEVNIDKAIDDVLQPKKNDYILHREYMDTKRIYTKKYIQELKSLYKMKYKNIKLDLILSSDNNAFNFLRKYRNELFGNVPVSFCGVNFFKQSDLKGLHNYTGIAEQFDAKSTVDIALKLKPETKNIFIINDYLPTGRAWTQTIKEQLKDVKQNKIFAPNVSISKLKEQIKKLPKDSIVLLGVYFKDKNGNYFTYEQIGKIISQSSKVPIFCLLEFNLGSGNVVGGSVISGYAQGYAMSQIAKEILNGKKADAIPVAEKGFTKLIFDFNALKKYHCDSSKLPKNALILNKRLSFYQKHQTFILLIISAITLLTIIIIILSVNIIKRKRSEKLLKTAKEEVTTLNAELEDKINLTINDLEVSNDLLVKQKEIFQSVFNQSKDPIAVLDMQSNFLKVNPAYSELSGLSEEELLQTSCLALTPPKDVEASKNALKKVIEVGFIRNFEKDCIVKNGKKLAVNMSMSLLSNPTRILIIVRDITKYKKVLEQLEQERNYLNLFYNNDGVGILLVDKKRTNIEVNNKFLQIWQYSEEEIIGKNTEILHVSHESYTKFGEMAFNKALHNNKIDIEYQFKRKDGTLFWGRFFGEIFGDNNVLWIVTDITDIKKEEDTLKTAKNKAEEATKLKSQFLANMSHEIRTPMNGIIGMLHLISHTNLDEKQKHYFSQVKNSANSLLTILNDILDFSKIEAGKFSIEKIDFDMNSLREEIESITEVNATAKGLGFEIICAHKENKDCIFYGDSLRIKQVLTNLLNNAIKFTHKGKISLTISHKVNDMMRFEVQDTGIGLSKEQQSKLFEAFTQADGSTTRKYGGTGLGLSISKQLVELMDGKIWVESKEGIGSNFIFEIPLPKGNMENIEKKITQTGDIRTLKGSQILLVEDNKINQEIFVGLLEHSGIKIDIANNGQEAVNIFKKNPKLYELIFIDLQMPIMGGIEATQIIRNTDKHIPIIALTANAMDEDTKRTKAAGMQEHLTKPIKVDKLYRVLVQYISKKVDTLSLEEVRSDTASTIPPFQNMDTKVGLAHVANNEKLYLKILNDFYNSYANKKIEIIEDKELKMFAHTLKGLCATIGAKKLVTMAKNLEESEDRTLLVELKTELAPLLTEIKEKLESKIETDKELIKLESDKRDEMFSSLKEFIRKRRARNAKELLRKLKTYELSNDDEIVLTQVETLLQKREYKNILKILHL